MKKILSLSILCISMFFFYAGRAQNIIFSSDFESWSGNVPTNWVGAKTTLEADSISPYTLSAHSPTNSCKLVNTESAHKRFTTQPLSVTNGTMYYVSYWVRGHGSIRLGMYDGRAGNGYATYHAYTVLNSTTWTHISDTITCKNTTSAGEFVFSVQLTFADQDHLQIDDVSITDGPVSTDPLISLTYPKQDSTYYGAGIPVFFNVMNFIVGNPGTGIDGHIKYTVDGVSPTMYYSTTGLVLSGLTTGNHELITQLVDNSDLALIPNAADTVSFNINLTIPNPQTIYNIQYSTSTPANSPFVNTVTTTTGIVTGAASAGYFIQDGTGSWNGIYIYDNIHKPAIGDNVTVTGTVKEFYGYTEFASVNGLTVISSGNSLPAATIITSANIVDTTAGEPFEGVLVKITDVPCSKVVNTYGEWQVYDGDTANIDDMMYHFTPVLSTHYDVTGIIYLTFSKDFIEPRDANDIYTYVGINESSAALTNVNLYPNPASEILNVSNLNGATLIRISNVLGETIQTLNITGENKIINTSDFPSGLYFITLQNGNEIAGTGKFLKE